MKRAVPGRPRRLHRRAALVAAMLLAGLTVVATVGAPADAEPGKDRPSHAGPKTTPKVSERDSEPVTDAAAAPALRRAALRIVVTTSSDWVRVDLPGVSAGHLVVEGDRAAAPTDRGVLVTGPLRTMGTVTVDVVTEVVPELDQGWLTVTQGGVGRTAVHVLNRTDDVYEVASASTDWSTTRRSVPVEIDALIGPEQLQWVRADEQRRVLAFTYPWFGGWAETDPSLSVHPTDPWQPGTYASALAQAERARANGIDGFVMSFAGGARDGLPLYQSLAAARDTGGTATILLETRAAASAAEAEQWLVEALRQSDSPAFMRLDGVPVVFTFATGSIPATAWQAISDRLAAAGTPVHIVADDWVGDGGPMTGLYRYNALLQAPTDPMTTAELTSWNQSTARRLRARATLGAGDPGLVVATVQPGLERRNRIEGEPVIERGGTETYESTWQAALAGEPDWVVITSWNEWFEGTGIAPSVEHGDAALVATAAWAHRLGS